MTSKTDVSTFIRVRTERNRLYNRNKRLILVLNSVKDMLDDMHVMTLNQRAVKKQVEAILEKGDEWKFS